MARGVIRRMLEAAERALTAPEERRVPDASRDERAAPSLLRVRSMAKALLLGTAAGAAIPAMAGCVAPEGYLAIATQGAIVGLLLRLWMGWPAARPGRTRRVILVSFAGVILFAGEAGVFSLVTGDEVFDPSVQTWQSWFYGWMLGSLLGASMPAFLLAAWAERGGLRRGWAWWPLRGLASAVIGAPLSAVALNLHMALTHGLRFTYSDLWLPLEFLWEFSGDPSIVLMLLGPTVLLAGVVGADSRWRVGRGSGPPGVPASPAPASPTPAADPARNGGLDFAPHPA